MPLTGKYLKYSPEITLEIFTLVWDKFAQSGYDLSAGINTIFKNWKTWICIIIEDNNICTKNRRISNLLETTVQEILGYDPFVKDFVLPEKWYCSYSNKEEFDIMNKFFIGNWGFVSVDGFNGCTNLLNCNHWFFRRKISDDIIKITFEQFKKYVLKESIETPKEVIPEYVECIGLSESKVLRWSNHYTIGNIYKLNSKPDCNFTYIVGDDNKEWACDFSQFKPSTKEAFDAQNNQKFIEKWNVGSYAVALKDGVNWSMTQKGDIYFIDICDKAVNLTQNSIELYFKVPYPEYKFKWFATKSEAEEFAKTLVEPVKEVIQLTTFPIEGYCKTDSVELRRYLTKRPNTILSEEPKWIEGKSIGVGWNERSYWIISEKSSKPEYQLNQLEKFFTKEEAKQPLKQAVHCKTQEEWDFVSEKLGYKWSKYSEWNSYKNNTCMNLNKPGFGTAGVAYKGYQILSFQEWCDLNGYKMEKEVKFEVGKWYKLSIKNQPLNYLLKCSKLNGKSFYYSQYIILDKSKLIDSETSSGLYSIDIIGDVVSIEEIQQYLPDEHSDKMRVNREFKVGDWVYFMGSGKSIVNTLWQPGKILQIKCIIRDSLTFHGCSNYTEGFRHATPEEINNHLISIEQIPAGEPLNTGIEPNKDGMFKYKQTTPGAFWSGGTIDNHLDVMIQSKTQSEIEFNYLPEPK